MIKLIKGKEPIILTINKNQWTMEYLSYINNNTVVPKAIATRYNDETIKAALIAETNGKCMYCESKFGHVSFGDIEHILPKKYRPDLIVEWTNLGLACEECNRKNKNDYYDTQHPLIDPYQDDPCEELFAAGALIFSLHNTERGELTKEVLKLNRIELLERRGERIKNIDLLIKTYMQTDSPVLRKKTYEQILREIENDKEYVLCVKSFLKAHKLIA